MAQVEHLTRLEDYPYDPKADIRMLVGLDRLRAVRDRRMARQLFELWFHAKQGNSREIEAEAQRRDEEDLVNLESMTDKALEGVYGNESKSLAMRIVQPHRNAVTMKQLRRALSDLGERRKSG